LFVAVSGPGRGDDAAEIGDNTLGAFHGAVRGQLRTDTAATGAIEELKRTHRGTGADERPDLTTATVDEIDGVESGDAKPKPKRKLGWTRVLAYGVLPGVALLLALSAGLLKWQDNSVRDSDVAGIESVQAAKDSTVAMLSYRPDSVDKDLAAARDRLTGNFRDSYTSPTNDVVIPGAQQKHISAVATVPRCGVDLCGRTPFCGNGIR
jgi:Mce-associated membrane protein